jgi:DUF4097 and DUF4098 domain-containing protein YvlB
LCILDRQQRSTAIENEFEEYKVDTTFFLKHDKRFFNIVIVHGYKASLNFPSHFGTFRKKPLKTSLKGVNPIV